jgi:hypothetical protein
MRSLTILWEIQLVEETHFSFLMLWSSLHLLTDRSLMLQIFKINMINTENSKSLWEIKKAILWYHKVIQELLMM